ncbi:uracil-DNA glycosylase family protein [Moraxella sp. ZY200743]|uniref:uracil-DNA glycosylase family protein n=1 Tax=Moraxella sp. ZY200743 TaxID=2911970 RepID=UPI003D7DE1DB
MNLETHPLSPFLPPNAKVLMLGSFPPPRIRWKMDFYYPNFNNDMWRIMGLVFFNDKDFFIDVVNKSFHQEVIERFLMDKGIAIFDVARTIVRLKDNASDAFLKVVEKVGVAELLKQMPACTHIITTGERSSEVLLSDFGIKPPKIGQSVQLTIAKRTVYLHRLPSSSRAYPLALTKKAAYYQAVFAGIFYDEYELA